MKKIKVMLVTFFLIISGIILSSQSREFNEANTIHHDVVLQQLVDCLKDVRAIYGANVIKITFIHNCSDSTNTSLSIKKNTETVHDSDKSMSLHFKKEYR